MSLPFSRDAFFAVFAAYNETLWPFAVVLWLLTASAFWLLVRDRARPGFISGLLAIHWAWAGLAYHAAFFSRINPAAWVFGGRSCRGPDWWDGTESFGAGFSSGGVTASTTSSRRR